MADAPASTINSLLGFPFLWPLSKRVYMTTGNVFWVSSTHANSSDDAYSGIKPSAPFKTIDYAIGMCTASQGDTILVMEGHTETCIAAGTITADVAGISIIGLGKNHNRPTIAYSTATGASFLISAANVLVENLYFNMTGKDALTAPINITASDCTIADCELLVANASGQTVNSVVSTLAADRITIEGCNIYAATSDAGLLSCLLLIGGDGHVIRRNKISVYGTTSLGCIENKTTACTRMLIADNLLDNRTAVSTKVVALKSDSTGWIVDNRVGILNGTAPFTAAAAYGRGGNYYSAAAGFAPGTLI